MKEHTIKNPEENANFAIWQRGDGAQEYVWFPNGEFYAPPGVPFSSISREQYMTTQAKANKAIVLARKHVGNGAQMESSARLCLADAIVEFDKGKLDNAHMWALKSLKYSVGVFHADYRSAQ